MFSGIVAERGRLIAAPAPQRGGLRLVIGHSRRLGGLLEIGGSLAVAGVCLTITERRPLPEGDSSAVEVSPETLGRTTLGRLADGSEVNLEPPLRVGDPLGGHWVQGHVDETVRVQSVQELAAHCKVGFELPSGLERYLVEKGSVALDGVSLTISRRRGDTFEVALIPQTLEVTTLSRLAPGDRVNLEVDILAKYVEQLLAAREQGR